MDRGDSETPWYVRSFRELYPLIYRHRDETSARREIEGLFRHLDPEPGAAVLDLCCGAGRHTAVILDLGFDVVGMDLSRELAAEARQRPGLEHRIVRGDMRRLPFADGSFDLVVNLFTSFGYFPTDAENAAVIHEMTRVLRPGGTLVIDHINRDRLVRTLVPESEEERDGFRIRQKRWIDDPKGSARALKEIEVTDGEGRTRKFFESVRLYTPLDFEALCEWSDLAPRGLLGSFDGLMYENDSERMILVAAKPNARKRSKGFDCEIEKVDYENIPAFGPGHILSVLAKDAGSAAGFPLLEKDAAPEPSTSPRMDRDRLAGILAETNDRDRVDPECRYVVAGQQAGLLTGPLYTILKAATAISLAADLQRTTGVPHASLFWMASEDHDLLEVNRCSLNGRRFVADVAPPDRRQTAGVPLEPHREALTAFLEKTLPAEDAFRSRVIEIVAAASFDSYATHFSALMRALFREQGLLIADPLALRPLTSPVLAALVEEWPRVRKAFDEGTAHVTKHGFEPPLAEPGFFEIAGGQRIKAAIKGKRITLSTGTHKLKEAAEIIRGNPDAFSPNAALRPVLQDAVIPVSAFVGGPSELLYLWQIDGLYAAAGVRRSRLRPRISATFLEPRARRAARKLDLEGAALFSARESPRADAGAGAARDEDVSAVRDSGRRILEAVDAMLAATKDKSLRRSRDTLSVTVDKICARMQAIKSEKTGRNRRNLEKLADAVLPGGKLQERVFNVFEFYSRHGPDFLNLIVNRLDPWAEGHHVVDILPARHRSVGAPDEGDDT